MSGPAFPGYLFSGEDSTRITIPDCTSLDSSSGFKEIIVQENPVMICWSVSTQRGFQDSFFGFYRFSRNTMNWQRDLVNPD